MGFMTLNESKSNFESQMENHLAEIWFKQVEPLYRSMKENFGIVNFVSDRFARDSYDIAKRISEQKKGYYKLARDLNLLSTYDLSPRMQEYVFSISQKLLTPALKYGYADEALELVKILKNESLVGDFSKQPGTEEMVEDAIEKAVAIYGLRFMKEGQLYIKNMARDLINEADAGNFGACPNLTTEHLKGIFLSPHKALQSAGQAKEKAE